MTGEIAFAAVMFGLFVYNVWVGYHDPSPAKPPQAPEDSLDAEELVALPFQLIGGLAVLLWCAIGLLVFLSPVLALAWLVLR